MTYRPTFRKQGDGSPCQWQNCGPASAAMASDRAREGIDPNTAFGWKPMPDEIRKRINAVYGTGCKGTTFAQNEAACATMFRVDLQPRYNIPWATFRSMINSGRGAQLAIQYSAVPNKFDGSPGFNGGHSVFVNERRASDGAFLVYDPLADKRRPGIPQGPDWWPASVLRAAAEAYPGTVPGSVHCQFTIDTE